MESRRRVRRPEIFHRHFAAACLCALGLGGCSFTPAYVRPALPTPAVFPNQAETTGSVATIGWRDFFPDPELASLIQTALANNRDLRVATARLDQARAQAKFANAQLYPRLDAVAAGTRGRTPADLSPTGQAETAASYQAVLQAAWEVDLWGRLRAGRASARETYLASAEGRRAVATTLVEQVVIAYLLEAEYQERMQLARRMAETREQSLRIMRRRYEVGSGSKLDMEQAELLLRQAQLSLQGLEGDRAVNRDALDLLVGQPVEISSAGLDLEKLDRPAPTGLPSELLANRPDVAAAEHQLKAANADIGAARAAFFPNISLTAQGGTASAALEHLFRAGQGTWSFAPTLAQTVFDAGRNGANLDLAKAKRDEAVAGYERTIQQAFRDVADALARRRQLAAQIATTESLLLALEERARLADLRFANGRSAYLEVLDAQRNLFNAQQDLVQLKRAYLTSGVALYAALGGGFAADGPLVIGAQTPDRKTTP